MRKLSFTLKYALSMIAALLLLSGCAHPMETASVATSEPIDVTIAEALQQRREGIRTILTVCTDTFEVPTDSGAYRNSNKVEFLMILILDENQKEATVLQLNPDTVVRFSAQGMQDEAELPLELVYSYGSGGSDSCLNVKKVVSKLLCGVPMDYYMTFTSDSLVIVNDMLGGVLVPGTEDIPEYDEPLMGDRVKDFFCFREEADVSNAVRMEHQRQYIAGLYQPFVRNAQDENFLTRLTIRLGDGLATDLTLTQMTQLLQSMGEFALNEQIVTIAGNTVFSEGQAQFYIDEDALNQTVNSLFFS